jgi:hypothetical protein
MNLAPSSADTNIIGHFLSSSLPVLTAGAGAGGVGGLWGFWTWLSARSKAKADAPAAMLDSQARFQQALNDHSTALLGQFKDEIEGLRSRIDALETEDETCRSQLSAAEKRISILELALRREGIPIPAVG